MIDFDFDDDDPLIIESIDDDVILFSVYEEANGKLAFRSQINNPIMLARLLTGITSQVLESQLGPSFRD